MILSDLTAYKSLLHLLKEEKNDYKQFLFSFSLNLVYIRDFMDYIANQIIMGIYHCLKEDFLLNGTKKFISITE